MSPIYKDPQVEAMLDLFAGLLDTKKTIDTAAYLQSLAERLFEGYQKEHTGIVFTTGRFFNSSILADYFKKTFTLENAQWCIAQEHGYQDWDEVLSANDKADIHFELLIDDMLTGNEQALISALQNKPELIHQQSHYPHKATLLHYTGSNGIEGYRQIVPQNLAKIVEYLLHAGADTRHKAKLYNGCTARELLETSKHPYEAGVIKAVQAVYERLL